MLGYMIGNELDKSDKEQLTRVYDTGESGEPVAWTNPDTGNQFQATPAPAYIDPKTKQICR